MPLMAPAGSGNDQLLPTRQVSTHIVFPASGETEIYFQRWMRTNSIIDLGRQLFVGHRGAKQGVLVLMLVEI